MSKGVLLGWNATVKPSNSKYDLLWLDYIVFVGFVWNVHLPTRIYQFRLNIEKKEKRKIAPNISKMVKCTPNII